MNSSSQITIVNPLFEMTGPTNILKNKRTKWYEGPLTEIPWALKDMILNIWKCVDSVFENYSTNLDEMITKSIPKDFLGSLSGLKKIAVLSILTVPYTLYSFIEKIVDLGQAIFEKTNRNKNILIIANAAALAVAELGKVFSLPETVVNVIRLFIPLKDLLWLPPLAIVSAVLSVGNFFSSCLNHVEAKQFTKELKSVSNKAILHRLKELQETSKHDYLARALNKADKTLSSRIDQELKRLEAGSSETLHAILKEIKDCSLDPELLLELRKAGNLAYLDCIKNKDQKFLLKHFNVKKGVIPIALENISKCSGEEAQDLKVLLSERLKNQKSMGKISMIIDTVNIIATVILVVSSFVLAASPLAPLGYVLLIGLGISCIIKFIEEHKRTKKFEDRLIELMSARGI